MRSANASLNMHIFCARLLLWDNIKRNHFLSLSLSPRQMNFCMCIQLWCQEMATCFGQTYFHISIVIFNLRPLHAWQVHLPYCNLFFISFLCNFNHRSIISFLHDDHCWCIFSSRYPRKNLFAFISLSFHLNFLCQRIITRSYTRVFLHCSSLEFLV